jgi:hypothetical protein
MLREQIGYLYETLLLLPLKVLALKRGPSMRRRLDPFDVDCGQTKVGKNDLGLFIPFKNYSAFE